MIEPSRLILARKRAGLTASALARHLDVSAQSVHNYEAGRQSPSDATLAKLGKILELPPQFFFLEAVPDLGAGEVTFRARTKMSSRARDAALCSGQLSVSLRQCVLANFKLPKQAIPSLEHPIEPALAAEYIRSRWGLDNRSPAPNMVHLLESKGVAVFSLPATSEQLDAFAFWRNKQPYVMMSLQKSAERGRFDAAHELGHLFLHQELDAATSLERDIESEANEFASNFLLPSSGVRRRVRINATVEQLIREKTYWRVAAVALAHRLHKLGMMSDWVYRSNVVALGRLGYRHGEPGGVERERSLLFRKVFASRRGNEMMSALSDVTALPASVIGELTFSVQPAPVPGSINSSEPHLSAAADQLWPKPNLMSIHL